MSGELFPAIGDFPVGARIASYQIEQLIGRGGMATVYRAKDVRLARQVALKVLTPQLSGDRAFRQRFVRESRSAASVDHPNIIPVFEAGESDGVLFIAMRYVTGQDVRALIDREGSLPPGRVVNIVTQVASALDTAHAHGLIHRDVKPANMLLASVETATTPDHVYLSDFGLSKVSLSAPSLTGTGQFLGTIDYMSPEQVEGRPVDGRTDLYALACTTFEMLTGEPPFRREQNLAVMWAQVSAAPPSVRDLRPDLPLQVDHVLARALAKSPASRQATCLEFASELRSACAAAPSPAGIPPLGSAGQVPLVTPVAQATELALGAGDGRPSHPPTAAIGLPQVGAAAAGSYEDTITEAAVGAGTSQESGHPHYFTGSGEPGGPPGQSGQTDLLWPGRSGGPPSYPGQSPPPRRGRRVVSIMVGLLIVAILLGAGYEVLRLRASTNPHGVPTSPFTKTVTSTASPSNSASSSPGNQPHHGPTKPAAVVTGYYNAVNDHDYRKAWRLNYHVHSLETYQQFKAGFVGTEYTTLTIVSVSGDAVNIRLAATQTDGTVKYYAGTYTVQHGTIVDSAIQQTG